MTEETNDTHTESDDIDLDWYYGYNQGYVSGFDAGIAIGRDQGYEDCLYRIKQMAENVFDPELEKAIKILTGDE